MKRLLTRATTSLILPIATFISFSSHAYDCSDLPTYNANTNFTNGSEVQSDDSAYRCTVEGWCNTGSWAYEPGTGTYYQMAWEDLGACIAPTNGHAPKIIIGAIREKDNASLNQVHFKAGGYDLDGDIVSWKFSVYENNYDTLSNPMTIGSGNTPATNRLPMATLWTWTDPGNYLFEATVTDSNGNTTIRSAPFEIKRYGDYSVNAPDIVLAGEASTTRVSANSQAPNNYTVTTTPDLTVTPGASFSASSSSSTSSGGGGVNYYFWQDFNWTAELPGSYVMTINGQSTEFNVLPADGLPTLDVTYSDEISVGDMLPITVQALDRKGITNLVVSLDSTELEPLVAVELGRFTPKHGRANTYLWQATEGTTSFTITATDDEHNVVSQTHDIVVIADPCEGNNASTINHYPNWTQVDWKGDPSHADTGDLMQYQGNVFRALWWTQSTPGSNNAWEFVCNI